MAGKKAYSSDQAKELLAKMRKLVAQAEEARQNAAAAAFNHDPKTSRAEARKVKGYMKQALHLNVALIQLMDPEAADWEKEAASKHVSEIEIAWEDAKTEAGSAHK